VLGCWEKIGIASPIVEAADQTSSAMVGWRDGKDGP